MKRGNQRPRVVRFIFLAQLCLSGVLFSGCSLPVEPAMTSTPVLPTAPLVQATSTPSLTPSLLSPTTATQPLEPTGKIVWTCQVYGQQYHDQICIENADGSGYRQLTDDAEAENYYPSFAPDGNSLVYASNRSGKYEIYVLDLGTDASVQLTHGLGEVAAPAISPDGRWIVFANNDTVFNSIWRMRRDGSDPQKIFGQEEADALDPSWSPDGTKILFAFGRGTDKQLYTINPDGSDLHLVSADFRTRGRSDWSPDGSWIASYAGSPWNWGMYFIKADGSGVQPIQVGGVALAPAFSPDGEWIVFTGYLDHPGDPDGCEIYVMRLNGSLIARMTYNNYCDYQPRWGP
ncbi:MAG: hypothetical protein ABSB41_07690 [Anaerolineales bacterium]